MHTVEDDGPTTIIPASTSASAQYIIAVYGSSQISEYSADGLSLGGIVPAEQSGNFPSLHASVARNLNIQSPILSFHNLLSFISFSTNREEIKTLVFAASDNTPLHGNGKVIVHFEDDIPIASYPESGGNSITLHPKTAGTFYLAILPTTLLNGFSISCYDGENRLLGTAIGRNSLKISRNAIVHLGLIDSHIQSADGLNLGDYYNEHDWDPDDNSGGDVIQGFYHTDYSWDTEPGNAANAGKTDYDADASHDTDNDSNADISQGGYNTDNTHDTPDNTTGNINNGEYGADQGYDSNPDNNANAGKEGYGNDTNHDADSGSGSDVTPGGYGNDQDHDTDNSTQGNVGTGDYPDDKNHDNQANNNADVGKGGYGADQDHDTPSGGSGGVGQGDYGDDANHDTENHSDGNVDRGGYGEDTNHDEEVSTDINIGNGGYGDDANQDNDPATQNATQNRNYNHKKQTHNEKHFQIWHAASLARGVHQTAGARIGGRRAGNTSQLQDDLQRRNLRLRQHHLAK